MFLGLKRLATRQGERNTVVSNARNIVLCVVSRDTDPPWQAAHIVNKRCILLQAHANVNMEYVRRTTNVAVHNVGRACLNRGLYGILVVQVSTFLSIF